MTARVGDESGSAASVPVRVRVSDVNDNAPEFAAEYGQLETGEDAAVGTSLAVISATDMDHGINAQV